MSIKRNSETALAWRRAGIAVALVAAACTTGQDLGTTHSAQTQYELKLQVVGTAAGSLAWTDGDGAHTCGAVCLVALPTGQSLTITETPGTGAQFTGWAGACSGSATTCTLTTTGDTKVIAAFSTSVNPPVAVTVVGSGSVSSSPSGIAACTSTGGTCNAEFAPAVPVTLTATAATGQTFNGWSGAGCTGTGTCVFTPVTGSPVTVSALFTGIKLPLQVSTTGTGSGIITSSPGAINCGGSPTVCAAPYDPATVVTLTATPSGTSVFAGWQGSGCSGTGTCGVMMDSAKSVLATFNVPGVYSAGLSLISASPSTPAADGVMTTTITVTALDSNNNPLSGQVVTVAATGSSNTLSAPPVTNSSGVSTATLSSTTAETKIISATVGGVALTNTASVTFSSNTGKITGRVIQATGGCLQPSASCASYLYTLTGIAGATVAVDGQSVSTTTSAGGTTACDGVTVLTAGQFMVCGVAAGFITVTVTPPASGNYLATDSRLGVKLAAGGTAAVLGNCTAKPSLPSDLCLSSHQTTAASYIGRAGCNGCHSSNGLNTGTPSPDIANNTHNRSLVNLFPTPDYAGAAFQRIYNPQLPTTRTVGLNTYSYLWPEDVNDIVDSGAKATNPNYDPNDVCIYGNAPALGTCGSGNTGLTTKYADGQVEVYLCNDATRLAPQYWMKFGGSSSSCSDGTIYNASTNPSPAVPKVHIATVYGGQGDVNFYQTANKQFGQYPKLNVGVFKQRYQAPLNEVKAANLWPVPTSGDLSTPGYETALDQGRDSLTLPVQLFQSGDPDPITGGPRLKGYHPTEQKFPGESWSQRTRTYSHACAGCHAVDMKIGWDVGSIDLQYPRADGTTHMTEAFIKSFSYADQNMACEHCHGPGSEHKAAVLAAGGTPGLFAAGRGANIVLPVIVESKLESRICAKCHTYDDGESGRVNVGGTWVPQSYGFEYPWSSENQAAGYGYSGNLPTGAIFDVADFLTNYAEMQNDSEAFWDPSKTGGALIGQAHRQQYTMYKDSIHQNNTVMKLACPDCHSGHSAAITLKTPTTANLPATLTPAVAAQALIRPMSSTAYYQYSITAPTPLVATMVGGTITPTAGNSSYGAQTMYKDNLWCLDCHINLPAEGTLTSPFTALSYDDLSAVNLANKGTVTAKDSVTQITHYVYASETARAALAAPTASCLFAADCRSYTCNGTATSGYTADGFGNPVIPANNGTCAALATVLSAPALATPTAGAGTLAATKYYYKVTSLLTTAVYGVGETAGSTEKSITLAAIGGVTLTWPAVTNATGYKVYRSLAAGTEQYLATVAAGSGTITFLDDGSYTPVAPTVPAANTTFADPWYVSTSAQSNVANVVIAHAKLKANMSSVQAAQYDPTNEDRPVGRCVTCHMPKVAQSGGNYVGLDAAGNKALIEGDQASHAMRVIWPSASNAISERGPTYQSAGDAKLTGTGGVNKYDTFDYMPNSCSKCHPGARRAQLYCPDTATVYPTGFPFYLTGSVYDMTSPLLSTCTTSLNAD